MTIEEGYVPPEVVGRSSRARELLAQMRGASIPIGVLVVVCLAAIFAPLVAPYGPDDVDPANGLAGPSWDHVFGTDNLGRDLFSRMVYGARLSLGIAIAATALTTVAGIAWGATAALSHRAVDEALMRAVDAFLGIPILLSALVFVAAFGASVLSLTVILALVFTPAKARVYRSAIQIEHTQVYSLAATAVGASRLRLLIGEILPNLVPLILVQATIVAAHVILTEAGLSFLGLGVAPPRASWGTLLFQGYQQLYASYWFIVFPGLAILFTIWALTALSDHVQSSLDPRTKAANKAGI